MSWLGKRREEREAREHEALREALVEMPACPECGARPTSFGHGAYGPITHKRRCSQR